MPIQIEQIHPLFVGRAIGVDLRRPIDGETVRVISEAADRYAVLVFPGQPLTDDELAAFGASFGPLYTAAAFKKQQVLRISNLDENDQVRPADDRVRAVMAGNELWHVDNTFSDPPAKYSMLLAVIVAPDGGETEFADSRAGYDALPPAMKKQVEELTAVHSFIYSRSLNAVVQFTDEQRAALPPRKRALVKTNPNTQRKSLYVTSHIEEVVGWPLDDGRALIRELTEVITQPRFVYRHRWNPGDLIMYDNRAAMHRVLPFASFAHPRDMRAIRVLDVADPDRMPA